MSLWSRLASAIRPRREPLKRALLLLPDGFEVVLAASGECEHAVLWDEVARIRTYKVDLFGYESICLLFETEGNRTVELSEEWPGFKEVAAAIEKFPGIPRGWYHEVAFPPFEANERILFER